MVILLCRLHSSYFEDKKGYILRKVVQEPVTRWKGEWSCWWGLNKELFSHFHLASGTSSELETVYLSTTFNRTRRRACLSNFIDMVARFFFIFYFLVCIDTNDEQKFFMRVHGSYNWHSSLSSNYCGTNHTKNNLFTTPTQNRVNTGTTQISFPNFCHQYFLTWRQIFLFMSTSTII